MMALKGTHAYIRMPRELRKLLDSSVVLEYSEWKSQSRKDDLAILVEAAGRSCSSPLQQYRRPWKKLSSIICCLSDEGYEYRNADEKGHLAGPDSVKNKSIDSALSYTDSYTSLIQRPIMVLPKDYSLFSFRTGIDTAAQRTSFLSVDTQSPTATISDSDPFFSLAPGKYPWMYNPLKASILDMEDMATRMLSSPSGINNFYLLLSLTHGSPEIRKKLRLIGRPPVCQPEPLLPCLPIMDPQWTPPSLKSDTTPGDVANIMDEAIFYFFRLTPFFVWRDAPYGNPDYLKLIADLCRGINRIYTSLRRLFREHPEQRAIYAKAKEVCR